MYIDTNDKAIGFSLASIPIALSVNSAINIMTAINSYTTNYILKKNGMVCDREEIIEWINNHQKPYCGEKVFEIGADDSELLKVKHSFNSFFNWSCRATGDYSLSCERNTTSNYASPADATPQPASPARSNRGRDKQ